MINGISMALSKARIDLGSAMLNFGLFTES